MVTDGRSFRNGDPMTDQHDNGFSAALRALARDARRLLVRGGGSKAEAAALSDRIDAIRDRAGRPTPTPLTRWLDSLQRRIDRLPAGARCRTPAAPAHTKGRHQAAEGRSGRLGRTCHARS